MSIRIQKILIRALTLVVFLILNMIGLKAFSAESLPTCQIASEGYVQNHWKKIRIQINDAIVAGAESLSGLSHQLHQLASEHRCLPNPVSCTLAASQLGVGVLAKHEIIVSEAVRFSARTTARVFEQLAQLRNMGVCE